MLFKKILVLITSLSIFSMTLIIQAEEKQDNIARVVVIEAKDGKNKQLEEAISKYHHYMGSKKGAFRYNWYRIETGSDTGKYVARTGDHSWEDFDVEHDWDEAAGKKFASDVQPYIKSATVSMTQSVDDIGIWPKSLKGYKFFRLTQWLIKSGKNDEFSDGLKKVDGILKKGNWPSFYAFNYTVSGGHGNSRMLVSPAKNYADMAPKEPKFIDVINKAMGKKKAKKFLANWSDTYETGNYFLISYLPKQSDYGDSK